MSKGRGSIDVEVKFTEDDAEKLVTTVYESGVEDEYLIDWLNLSEMFDESVTPQWLKIKWGMMVKELPRVMFLEFPEIVENLYQLYQSKKMKKKNEVEDVGLNVDGQNETMNECIEVQCLNSID